MIVARRNVQAQEQNVALRRDVATPGKDLETSPSDIVSVLRARVVELEMALTESSDHETAALKRELAATNLANELGERVRLACSERDAAQSRLALAQQDAAASEDLVAALRQAVDERNHAQDQLRLEREISLSKIADGQRQLVAVRQTAADEMRAAIEVASAAKLAQMQTIKEQATEQQARALEQCTAEMMEAVGNILQQAEVQREAQERERAAEAHREAAEAGTEGGSESERSSSDEDASVNPDVLLADVDTSTPAQQRVAARVLRARSTRRLVLEDKLQRLRVQASQQEKTASQLRAHVTAHEATESQLRAQLHALQAAAPAMEAAAQAAAAEGAVQQAEVEALRAKLELTELAVTDLEKKLQAALEDLKHEQAENAKLQTSGQAKPSFLKQVKRTPQYENETADSKGGSMFAKQVCVVVGVGVVWGRGV